MNTNVDAPSGDSKLSWFKKLFGKDSEQSLKSELEEIIQEHEEEGNAPPENSEIIRNVLNFSEVKVGDVMTPRPDICAAPYDITMDDLKKIVVEREHTRIPIFRDNLDEVVGFVHIKDLIAYWGAEKPFKIQDILREVLFVPPSMKLQNLLIKMQIERTHMAIVVDEYGGTDGLVTIEDIVEEIVGEIEDEHDEDEAHEIVKLADHVYEVSARVEVAALEEKLGRKIYAEDEAEDFDTIGGLIFTNLSRVPKAGESFCHKSGITFKVMDADKRRIKRVKVILGQGLG